MIRQPIVSVLGHIDHGKTSLLDKIRGSAITEKEAGGITQHIGATEVPMEVVKKLCGNLLKDDGLKTPGLLFIDTPGHAAFTNLRKRGGSISDMGILVVDVNEGFKPQTHEALSILKSYKTPFLVAANKVDLIPRWNSQPEKNFMDSFKSQQEDVQQNLDMKLYSLVENLYKADISSERYDRVNDFAKQVAIVPFSAKTGEGLKEILMVLVGLVQRYMEEQLEVHKDRPAKGSVLEVKQSEGLGTTMDVILYDGTLKKGDKIVVGTLDEPLVTNTKAIFLPNPLAELRVEKKFKSVDQVTAAIGVKISAPGLEDVIAGSPVYAARDEEGIEEMKNLVKSELEEIQIETGETGAFVKADTLGSLEALVRLLTEGGISVRKAEVGAISKKDITEVAALKEESPANAVIFAFNVKMLPGVDKDVYDFGIKVFEGSVVYSLMDDYKEWEKEEVERRKARALKNRILPGKAKFMKGMIFRQNKPAVVGLEVLGGTLKPKSELMNKDGISIGTIKEMQKEGENIHEATRGDQISVSIDGASAGKNIFEGDEFYVKMAPSEAREMREKLADILTGFDIAILEETEKIARKK